MIITPTTITIMIITTIMIIVVMIVIVIVIISRSTTYDITDDSFGAWLVVRCGWVALIPADSR